MDNLKYHKTYAEEDVPKGLYKFKKAQLHKYLQSKGIPYNAFDTDKILLSRAREHIKNLYKFECVKLAEEQGHKVVFTATCYLDLQPIKLVVRVLLL